MSTTDEREAYQGDEQDFRHKQSLRTDAATTHNGSYVKSALRWAGRRNPAPAAEGEYADWCPVCGGKDGQHLHGCEGGSEVL